MRCLPGMSSSLFPCFPAIIYQMSQSIYLHIPFCRRRCTYCDFTLYPGLLALRPDFIQALAREIYLAREEITGPVETIFFGGGTPSLLSLADWQLILGTLLGHFDLVLGAEVTAEANPENLSLDYLLQLHAFGINRLSMGVQTFDDHLLHLLGRGHTATQAMEAFARARQSGFENLNLDLIYGLPGQTLAMWQLDLEIALDLQPEHISAYGLQVELHTPLEVMVRRGRVPAPLPDLAADMYDYTCERLAQAGYQHYEISNWAKPGYESRHNLTYWRNQPYVGLGPGAHGYDDHNRRYKIETRLRPYLASVQENRRPLAEVETLDLKTRVAETAFLGLRLLQEGVDLTGFENRFGLDFTVVYAEVLPRLQERGLIELVRTSGAWRVRLTQRAYLVSNPVMAEFLEPALLVPSHS
ncbi:MAG: radical SAM family heme chaperone HemW [Chloroflexi bacterium]|nr:radical SAM family heme chaperone HemW [Chloroflexota bacterium]